MSSGEAGVGEGVGSEGGEGAGGCWQPLNTLQTPSKCKPGVGSGEAGWGVGGGGGEGAGRCGHALAAFLYFLNT